jgi:hypothetical protein
MIAVIAPTATDDQFPSLFLWQRCSVIVDGDRDIRCCHSARYIIIHIILLVVFVFHGSQSEESDQTKAHQHQP